MELVQRIFKKENRYWFFLGITMILCYGFALSNISMGVDDEAASYYWEYGGQIIQGRYGVLLLSRVFDITDVLPFWRDFIGILVLGCSATVFVTYFQACSGNSLSGISQIIFACVFVSVPVIAFAFIFLLYVIEFALTLLLAGLALIFLWNWFAHKRWYFLLFAVLLVAFGSSFYEYCVNHFVTGALCGYLLSMKNRNEKSAKKFLIYILTVAAIAAASLVILFTTAGILRNVYFGATGSGYAMGALNIDVSLPFLRQLLGHAKVLFLTTTYFKVYVIMTVLFFIVCLVQSIKNKNAWIIVSFILIVLSTYMMQILQGAVMITARTLIVYTVYYGFAGLYIYESFTKKWIHGILVFAVILTVFYHSKEMNTIFYTDYLRYKLDLQRAYSINEEITKLTGDNPEEPVVFVGMPDGYHLTPEYPGQVVGETIFAWDGYFGRTDNPRPWAFMALEGMQYNGATEEQAEEAGNIAYFMPDWPKEGSVVLEDGLVVVRFSSPQYAVLDQAEAQALLDASPSEIVNYEMDEYDPSVISFTGQVHGYPPGEIKLHVVLYSQEQSYVLPTTIAESGEGEETPVAFASYEPPAGTVGTGTYEIKLLLEYNDTNFRIDTNEHMDVG